MRTIKARREERGVSILLLAVCLAALLAMAALAIDVVTLYVARTEAQRAADAAALAGARMLAGSGYTSSPSSWTATDLCQNSGPGAAAGANVQAEAVAAQNQIAGQAAAVKTIACDLTTNPGNPQMTVTVQRTNLPTFFARIWGRTASSVTASSTAEAYNPSGFSVPIQTSGVKPWLVPNCDPDPTNVSDPNLNCPLHGVTHYSRFVNSTSGSIDNNGSFIGETIEFQRIDAGAAPAVSNPPPASQFYALDIDPGNPPTLCPSTSAVSCSQVGGGDNYIDNIACHSAFQFNFCQPIGASPITVLSGGGLGRRTREATECLIHASGVGLPPGPGQDAFTPSGGPPPSGTSPVRIDGGNNNPNPALQGVQNISRSDSIVTVPLYDGGCIGAGPGCSPTTTVIGFLQLGIVQTETGPTRIQAVILNALGLNTGGCSSPPSGTPVSGGGISAIPVRLVHQ